MVPDRIAALIQRIEQCNKDVWDLLHLPLGNVETQARFAYLHSSWLDEIARRVAELEALRQLMRRAHAEATARHSAKAKVGNGQG